MALLSLVIPVSNEGNELTLTLGSLWASVPPNTPIEVVVVDDASHRPIEPSAGTVLIRNEHRIGVDPSRHIGACTAKGDVILVTDAHMRFVNGWYPALMDRLAKYPKAIICGVCLALQHGNMDTTKPLSVYFGGTINVNGPDRNNGKGRKQVLEAVWGPSGLADDTEIPACLGACYGFHKDWFLHLAPLHNLRSWGESELALSVKSWLAGGSVRLCTGFRIGHKWRLKTERVPFKIPSEDLGYNKLFAILTLTPEPLRSKLVAAYRSHPLFRAGMELIKKNWGLVLAERARNESIFTRDFMWLAQKFSLPLP